MGTNAELYEQDFYTWCLTTAELIRAGKWHELDPGALAEEIESLGHQDKEDMEQHLQNILTQLLLWWAKPDERCGRWRSAIRTLRYALARLLRDSSSLQTQVPGVLSEEYPTAREKVLIDTGLYSLPDTCPFTPAQVLDETFWPEGSTLTAYD